LQAVFLALKAFLPHLTHKVVLVWTDSDINVLSIRTGGTQLFQLSQLAQTIWKWVHHPHIHLLSEYLPWTDFADLL
ncbi:hypothetical protein NDU88_002898, partial [Pleurodeles waltl]